ncbi:MAG: HAD-superfamily hydrolase, subfamily [Chloroflexi bacterium]|nr:HAD-superfamily hydrolase, subfamily [Chloroflexota bacterium]
MKQLALLSNLDALLIDMDGVVYRGDTPLPGAIDTVPTLQRLGIACAFVTNNTTLGAAGFQSKLAGMGIEVEANAVVTSAEATATYLGTIAAPGTRTCVVGERGLTDALETAGFVVSDDEAAFVVVGLDRAVTYDRLAKACLAIQRGARLIATNADASYPVEEGYLPGAGAILAALTTATRAEPTIIGKPKPALLEIALGRLGCTPDRAAMVGDQLDSDIQAGQAAGMRTIWVKSDVSRETADVTPDVTVETLAELLNLLEQSR